MSSEASVVITARNASPFINRAVASALVQGDCPILLVDDWSEDDTVARAMEIARGRMTVIRPTEHRTLGFARQTALQSIATPFAVWLDADDVLLPGRVSRMTRALRADSADLAADALELHDGPTGGYQRTLSIPVFLRALHPQARLFERNFLPGIGVLGFRTDFARQIGYDAALHGAEDIDFVLRAVASGARFALLDSVGYRQYAYPGSLSRDIANQRMMYSIALRKHTYDRVRELYARAGLGDRITYWGLASMAIFREDYEAALDFVDRAAALMRDPDEVLEPEGPYCVPEGWRSVFYRGTIRLLLNGVVEEAVALLREAERAHPTPEGSNNLAVALRKAGATDEADRLLRHSLGLYPEYRDARINSTDPYAAMITTHALRSTPVRSAY
jgi:glycosyltransferase involved in cell wall biosynthesis